MKSVLTASLTLALAAAIQMPGLTAAAHAANIELAPESYRTRFNSALGAPDAFAEDAGAGTLGVSVLEIAGPDEYYRPILQFDLSAIDQPVTHATFNIYLVSTNDNPEFDIHLYGSTDNRSAALAYDDFGAADEFFGGSSYQLLHADDEPFIERTADEDNWYTLDVTSFLSDRYSEYLSGGDSFVFLRLQPHTTYDGTGLTNSLYNFAGYGWDDGSARPYLNVIPEPASLALLGAGSLLIATRRRHHA